MNTNLDLNRTDEPIGIVASAEKDYTENFMPAVHKLGRVTMVIALFIAFLPAIYFYFIRSYQLPVSSYIAVIASIVPTVIGMWLTEPLTYWPILGSAGTYMGYLSGNVSGMRSLVALSVQSSMKADINTPRGQIVTIIAIVASIFCNLVILLGVVLFGAWFLTVLPESVQAAFAYITPCIFAALLMLRFSSGNGTLTKNVLGFTPYLIPTVVVKLIITYAAPQLTNYAVAISVGVAVLIAYFIYRKDAANAKGTA